MRTRSALLLAVLAFLPACGDSRSTDTGDDPDLGADCPIRWIIARSPSGYGGSAAVADGALVLRAPSLGTQSASSSVLVSMHQRVESKDTTLDGDFTVTIQFESFMSEVSGGAFTAEIGSGDGTIWTQVSSDFISGGYVSNLGGEDSISSHNLSATSGTMQFVRSGATITATVSAEGQSATTTGQVSMGPVPLRLNLFAAKAGRETTVHVTSIEVSGSTGTFQSDSFECIGAATTSTRLAGQ